MAATTLADRFTAVIARRSLLDHPFHRRWVETGLEPGEPAAFLDEREAAAPTG